VAIIAALPLTSLLLVVLMRRRVLLPLRNLGQLMGFLAQQDYRSVPLDRVDPMIEPLYRSYNQMVGQLSELDRQQHELQSSLRGQVRQATRALLEQQRSLARAERLAAVGEVAAGLAHELRNPLAGLQVALGNLRGDLSDPEQRERLDHMLAEVRRVVQLLNGLLGQTQTTPDAEAVVELAPAMDELLALVRYQLPERITVDHTIPAGMRCRLPPSRLHQAMLNLVLNAAQAIGQRPGRILIHVSRQGTALHLSVEDDGPGLPEDLLRQGVRPFATWREEGTGLGLAVVRRFVQDLGGELRLANKPEGGARVTLVLSCEVEDA
jgi:two-component system NtrC family sensor kinase